MKIKITVNHISIFTLFALMSACASRGNVEHTISQEVIDSPHLVVLPNGDPSKMSARDREKLRRANAQWNNRQMSQNRFKQAPVQYERYTDRAPAQYRNYANKAPLPYRSYSSRAPAQYRNSQHRSSSFQQFGYLPRTRVTRGLSNSDSGYIVYSP